MDKSQAIDKVKKFSDVVVEKYSPEKIVLFGSYAKGNYNENSDIDVAVIVDHVEGDFLDNEANLYRIRRDIDFSLEPLLFIKDSDKSGFLDYILKNGEIIYERK